MASQLLVAEIFVKIYRLTPIPSTCDVYDAAAQEGLRVTLTRETHLIRSGIP